MNCKNCGHQLDGPFCSQCGQSAQVDRINLRNFLNEISESIFQINRGFFFTLKELTLRPGDSLHEFLAGKRKKHFKPLAYVLLLSTVYFMMTQLAGQRTWMDDLITGFASGAHGVEEEFAVPAVLAWFAKHFAYTNLLVLPVFSLASYWAFAKKGTNYLEHVVINSYITGHQAASYSVFALLGSLISHPVMEVLPVLVAIIYAFWVYWQFFSSGNRVINILRSVMTYFFYLILSTVLLLALMGIGEL